MLGAISLRTRGKEYRGAGMGLVTNSGMIGEAWMSGMSGMKGLAAYALFAAAAAGLLPTARAQSLVGTDACTTYLDAKTPAQQAVYAAYLQGFANAASPDPRYPPTDAMVADDARKIHEWCGRNVKSSYGDAVYAVLGAAIRDTHAAVAASAAAAAVAVQPQPIFPSSCRIAATNYCGGCSISCNGGRQAKCAAGKDNVFGHPLCDTQAKCDCE